MFESTTTSIEENLLEMPALPMLLDKLQHRLNDEQGPRAKFREWLTEDVKAEFINGAVVMHSPASDDHNEAVLNLGSSANFYAIFSKLGKVRVEKALIGMTRNDYEPDVAFWRKEVADKFHAGLNVYPMPDLIIEVLSPGKENERRDTKTKFEDYAAHGIPEYWIVDPKAKTVEQYFLSEKEAGRYELHRKVGIGDSIESREMKGFCIPVEAIFDAEANALAIRKLIASAG